MTDRTFKQYALGKLGVSTNIVAKIDGQIIFTGPVAAASHPFPTLPDYDFDIVNLAYSWVGNCAFEGSMTHEVSVTTGSLLLGDTVYNNPLREPEEFGRIDIGPAPIANTAACYPYVTEVIINGQSITPVSDTPWNTGQGWHELQSGDVLQATIHVIASQPYNRD